LQAIDLRGSEGQADQTARFDRHEVHDLGRDEIRGDDDVALVFTIFVVDEDDHFAVANVFDQFRNRVHFGPLFSR
jgi:hypothetical protein